MKAAQWHDQRDIRVEQKDLPAVGPGEVRIDVDTCGICGSDLHEYEAGPIFIPKEEPHPVTGDRAPLTMGHEFSGVVTEVGEGVTDLTVGDAVAVNPIYYCGECRQCREGNHNVCDSVGFIGLSGGHGGFAESTVVEAERAVPIRDDVPTEYGALVEPLSVGLHAVRRSGIETGDSVAIFGSGPIGLCVLQMANVAGAGEIFVSEPRAARRERALDCGADVVVDPTEDDAVDYITDATGGGADVSFEVAGVEPTFNQAVQSARPTGQVTIVSIFEDTVTTHPNDLVLGERTVTGTLAMHGGPRSGEEFGRVIDMLGDGKLNPEALVTDQIGLDEIVDGGFEALLDEDSDQVKIFVKP